MPRYYFHLMSPTNPVRDRTGVELAVLAAAHWHATRLVYRLASMRLRPARIGWLKVADESGAIPLVPLPRSVPMLREEAKPSQLGRTSLKLGRGSS